MKIVAKCKMHLRESFRFSQIDQFRLCYVMSCYRMLYFHLYYIIVLFPGQLRSLVKVAWDSPAHRANPRIHQCLLLELIHHFAVVMTNKT